MPERTISSVIFDLDGVITKTAEVHARAWKETFDEYLRMRESRDGEPFKEFTHDGDYLPHVDGKPRYEGDKSFLGSRGITVEYGKPSDSPDKETVCGIGNRKNEMFRAVLREQGADVYESTIMLIRALKKQGVRVGVASSSKNCKAILESAGIEELFETRVDGVVSADMNLRGKPEGDIFVTAARNLDCRPEDSVVFEDATSGVQAGRNGGFGLVVGIARKDNAKELLAHGADIVVPDAAVISTECMERWFSKRPVGLFGNWDTMAEQDVSLRFLKKHSGDIALNPCYRRAAGDIYGRKSRQVFFLDYDGTLSPIVDRPELAVIAEDMKNTVIELSRIHTVAIVSGRMREDVEKLARIPAIFYAGSHGFDIVGPDFALVEPRAEKSIPVIAKLIEEFKKGPGAIEGVIIEEKKFSVAVHYRLVKEELVPDIAARVKDAAARYPGLKVMEGKKVYEVMPDIDWNKGRAIRWIMDALHIRWNEASVTYIGDDVTDEYAFRVVRGRGTGILVSQEERPSAADFMIASPSEVHAFFRKILSEARSDDTKRGD